MDKNSKDKLKNIPRRKCEICKRFKSYTNPLNCCFECKKYFCYDHCDDYLLKNGSDIEGNLRNVCENCAKLFNYGH